MLLPKYSPIFASLIACLVMGLNACANNSTSKDLEKSLAADPKLQNNTTTLGKPANINLPTVTPLKRQGDLPLEIPLYPQAKLKEVKPASSDSKDNLTRWVTTDPINLVQNFYQKSFQTDKWEIVPESTDINQNNPDKSTLVARRNDLLVTVKIQPISSSEKPIVTPSPSTNKSLENNVKYATEFSINYSSDASKNGVKKPNNSDVTNQPESVPTVSDTTSKPGALVFSDVNKSPQILEQYVQDLAALGVLNINPIDGKSKANTSTEFEPNKIITRRQYARWLVAANNRIYANTPSKQIRLATETSQPTFQDINKTDPDFPAIQGLAEAGLIPNTLTGDSTAVLFRPDAPLTRENLILWKVPLDIRQGLPNASLDAVKQTWGFQDVAKIDSKALRAVLADFQNGDSANIRRLLGYTTLFQPQKAVTRAEAAAVLWYFGNQTEGISAKDVLQIPK